ncbi:MAG: hypothetical protein V1743_08335 [Nanoarchaeota archaeon]
MKTTNTKPIEEIVEALQKDTSGIGKRFIERLVSSGNPYDRVAQDMYSDSIKRIWFVHNVRTIYDATNILPQFSEDELQQIDEIFAKNTNSTRSLGIGHPDAGYYYAYALIADIVPLDKLPKYAQAVQKSYACCPTDALYSYGASRITPDLEAIATKQKKTVDRVVDDLYSEAEDLHSRGIGFALKAAYEMTGGRLPSKEIQEKVLTSYLTAPKKAARED